MVDNAVEDGDMDSEVCRAKYNSDRSSAELSAFAPLEHLSRLQFLRKFSIIFHANDERLKKGISEPIGLI